MYKNGGTGRLSATLPSSGSGTTSTRPTYQSPYEPIRWQFGLSNSSGKFLTAEPFSFKLTASGSLLKKRQVWVLLPDPQQDLFYLRSHLGRYLSADRNGMVTCTSSKPGLEERFKVEFHQDMSGRWALRNAEHHFYLEGSADSVSCFSKTPVWWNIHLAIHPQVHMKSFNRGRYLRLYDNSLQGDQVLAWGYDSLITLQPLAEGGGVVVCSRDWRFLANDGSLRETLTENCVYRIEVRAGSTTGMAFRDLGGRYLTLVGAAGTMMTKNKTIGRDELFVLEDSYPQVAILAANGKFASIKQGVDVYANQSEIESEETFQLEFHAKSNKLSIRTCHGNCWSLSDTAAAICSTPIDKDKNGQFELEHFPDATIAIRAVNGLYVSTRKLGVMAATADNISDNERFQLVLLNRPIIVLRTDNGFLGIRSNRVECNFVQYEAFQLIEVETGGFQIKATNGSFWSLSEDATLVLSRSVKPNIFVLQMRQKNQLAILAPNGSFLRAEQNGPIQADSAEPSPACMWEY